MAPVHDVHVLERGHVATLCCTNSRAFFVLYVRLFYFLDRSVLFSAIKMHVRLMISSQVMNAAEYCVLVKITASWLVQPFAGAADSKWGVSQQSSYMGWTFNHVDARSVPVHRLQRAELRPLNVAARIVDVREPPAGEKRWQAASTAPAAAGRPARAPPAGFCWSTRCRRAPPL